MQIEEVPYPFIRPLIKSGDLLAWRHSTLFAELIRHWTGGSYSHVGIAWLFRDRIFVLQDKEKQGINLVALSDNLPCDWISTGAVWTEIVETEAMRHLGQSYSFLNCILAGLNIHPVGVKRICSEYAYSILQLSGVIEKQHALTPVQLVDLLLDLGKPLSMVAKLE